jgi:WD40 repeat protein
MAYTCFSQLCGFHCLVAFGNGFVKSNRLLTALCLLHLMVGTLAAQDDAPPTQLLGHTAALNSVVYTGNQRFVVTAGADQLIKLWDTKTGKEVRSLAGHTAQVLCLAVQPGDSTFVSGGADNTLRLWDVPRPEPLRLFAGHTAAVRDIAVSPNGRWAVSVSDDKAGRLWNLDTGTVSLTLTGHSDMAVLAAARADSRQVATGDATGHVRFWSPIDGSSQGVLGAHVGAMRGLQFHPNNQQIVTAGEDGLLKLWQLPIVEPRLLAGHKTQVRAVAITNNSQLAVTGSDAGVRVFNVTTGQLVRELTEAVGSIATVAISPNNLISAAAGESGTIKFWNLNDGVDRLTISGHDQPINDLAFHADNARIASAGSDGTIRIWRLPVAPIAITGHTADVVSVSASSTGQMFASASTDKSVRIWNPTNGQAIRTLAGHQQPLTHVVFRVDGAQLASSDAAGEIRLWNSADGVTQGVLGAHVGQLKGIAYNRSGDRLATVGADGCLKIWKLPLLPAKSLAGHAEAVTAVALTSDSKTVIAAGIDKTIRVYDPATGQQTRVFADVPDAIASLAISSNDALTVAGANNGVVKLWNTADGTPWKGVPLEAADAKATDPKAPVAASELLGHDGAVVDVVFDRASKQIASAGADGTVRVWRLPTAAKEIRDAAGPSTLFVVSPDGKMSAASGVLQLRPAIFIRDLASGKILRTLLGHEAAITSIAFSPDGKRLASSSADKTARVWDLSDSKFPELQKIVQPTAISAVALSADATQLFCAAGDNVIRCWAVADGTEVRTFTGHSASVSSLSVSGQTLVSGAADSTVRVWNLQTGAIIRSINHAAAVSSIAVSPKGLIIASGGADKLVKLWTASTGAPIVSLTGHAAAIVGLRFNADGSKLVSGSNDGVWVWDVIGKRRLETFALTQVELRGVGFSGDLIPTGIADGSVRLLSPHLVRLIDAHVGGSNSVAFSADAKRLVTSGADKTVKFWSVADGKQLGTFAGPTDVVTKVVVTPDGKRVVAGGLDKTVRVWPLPIAAAAQPVPASLEIVLPAAVQDIQLNSDGTRVAIGGDDNVVRVWDLALNKELQRLAEHTAGVTSVAISADGTTVLSGSADKTARLSTLALTHIEVLEQEPNAVAFLPRIEAAKPVAPAAADADAAVDANVKRAALNLVTVGAGSEITIWNLDDKLAAVGSLPAKGTKPVGLTAVAQNALAVSANGKQVAALDKDGRVNVWDVASGQLSYVVQPSAIVKPAVPPAKPAPAGGLHFSADNSKLLVGHGGQVRVLQATNGRLLQRFDETSPVTALAMAPNNQTILIGHLGEQNNAELRQFSLERLIEAHEGAVGSLSFTPNGTSLVSGGADKQVRLWNLADGQLRRSYVGSTAAVTSVKVTQDGTRIVAGGLDKSVRIWPVEPPAPTAPAVEAKVPEVAALVTYEYPTIIRSISLSVNNLMLAACGDDGVVRVRDLATGTESQRFEQHEGPALAVAFAANNKTLVSGGVDKSARVLTMSLLRTIAVSVETPLAKDVAAKAPVDAPAVAAKVVADSVGIIGLALANAGTQAITVEADGVKHWNLANGSLIRKLEGGESAYLCAAVRNDNQQLIAADSEKNVYLWNLANGQLTTKFKSTAVVKGLSYSPDNNKIVAACDDNRLRFYSPTDGSLTYELISDKPVEAAVFTTDSRGVLTGGEKEMKQWTYASPTAVRTLTGHGGRVYGTTYSADGRWIASASADQTVRIWNAKTGVQTKVLSGHVGAVYSVSFSPDGALLISCGADKSIRLWDTLGGRQLKQIPVAAAALYSVAFFADGKRVATAGLDKKIYIVDAVTGVVQNTLTKHTDFVYRIGLNKTGTRLMSCGYGGNIKIWNAANGQPLFEKEIGQVANFADFAPDGQRVIVAGGDGRAYFIDVPTNAR